MKPNNLPTQIVARIKANRAEDTEFVIDNAGLSDKDVEDLVAMLRAHRAVVELSLVNNNIGDKGAESLATLTIKKLNVEGNNISDSGAEVLIKCENLTDLNLTRNNLHQHYVDTLLVVFNQRKTPLQLQMAANMLGDKEKLFSLKKK